MAGHTQQYQRIKQYATTEAASGRDNIPVEFFHETTTLTSAAAATAVSLIPDARVGSERKVYLQGFLLRVNGTTVWGTTANVKIQDTSAVDFLTVLVAALGSQARVVPVSGGGNVVLEDAYSLGTGGTLGKGLQVKGDANGTGSTLSVTVWGVIK